MFSLLKSNTHANNDTAIRRHKDTITPTYIPAIAPALRPLPAPTSIVHVAPVGHGGRYKVAEEVLVDGVPSPNDGVEVVIESTYTVLETRRK